MSLWKNLNWKGMTLDKLNDLIHSGADVNEQDESGKAPLHYAVAVSGLEINQELIIQGANVNVADNEGKTPLHVAAIGGKEEEIKALILAGADVNAKSKHNYVPLHYLYEHAPKITQFMIEAGADVNVQDMNGNTPLHRAVLYGSTELVHLLIKAKADVMIRNAAGKKPLDCMQRTSFYVNRGIEDLLVKAEKRQQTERYKKRLAQFQAQRQRG